MKQKFQKGFAPILILFLGLALAALGSMTYLQLKPQPPSQIPSPMASPIPTDETVYTEESRSVYTDEGSTNWETYTNSKYNFSFKYPPDFNFEREVTEDTDTITAYFKHKNYNADRGTYGKRDYESRNFSILLTTFNKSLEEYVVQLYNLKEFKTGKFEVFELGDESDIAGYITEIARNNYGKNNFIVVISAGAGAGHTGYFIKGPGNIVVTTNNGYGNNIEDDLFNQILSTFKFLD